ncbi:MAG: CocE/NonD family hydrolase C-terminal non-catalytic domain-containing protein [Gemmatimonadaceae bacterium]
MTGQRLFSIPLRRPRRWQSSACLASWCACGRPTSWATSPLRLEDVAPDGRVALVTGALRNGAFRHDRLRPAPLAPDEWFDLYATLHATTWVVQPGHRLRLAIATAQFPMAWPSPERRSAWVHTGPASRLELPTVPVDAGEPVRLPPSEPRAARPDARRLSAETTPPRAIHRGDTTIYVMQSSTSYVIGSTRIAYEEAETYRVRDAAPGFSSFRGVASHQIQHGARRVRLETTMDVRSTPDSFAISVRRVLHENGREVRDRTWSEVVPRRYH